MEPSRRIVYNTIAQYIKAIINIVLALYSTRLVLEALQVSDYGIYSLVGGVVSMLGFITNALIITTQRYISFYCGKGNLEELKQVFTNSYFLHWIISIILCIILLSLTKWLTYDILNIPLDRKETAAEVYVLVVVMLFLTILSSPFKALFIAHENIIYISIVETIDAIVKFLLALSLIYVQSDKLLTYTIMTTGIILLNLFAFAIYALFRFKECSISIHFQHINKTSLRQLIGFAGWTTYGMGAIAGRNQGTAIALNHFMGTAINASYGIAFQIYGAIAFVVTSVINAMNPQIMKAEGKGDREGMLKLACMESKYSTLLLAIATIPIIIEMPSILEMWLNHNVPPYTSTFCRFILIGFLFDQVTLGLHSANQAIGNIRNYSIIIYTPKLLFVLLVWLLLSKGFTVIHIMIAYIAVELTVALIRIPYLSHIANLNGQKYISEVIIPLIPACLILIFTGTICNHIIRMPFSFIFSIPITIISGIAVSWFISLNKEERNFIIHFIRRK